MQALKQIYVILTRDPTIQQFINLANEVAEKCKDMTPESFSESQHHKTLMNQLQKLRLINLEQVFQKLPLLPKITAIILKSNKFITIAFLMIPSNSSFGWHDHTAMNGLSKCLCGEITISTVNPKFLEESVDDPNAFQYPIEQLRTEKLIAGAEDASCIFPNSFNIHKITTGRHQSGFLDILMPEYPDDSCNYYQEVDREEEGKIRLKKIKESTDNVIGLQTVLKYFKNLKKPTIPQF